MSCGCCLDACPQFTKLEVEPHEGESAADFYSAKKLRSTRISSGAHAISQVVLFNNHPTG